MKVLGNNYFSAKSQLKSLQQRLKGIQFSIWSTTRHFKQLWKRVLSTRLKCKNHLHCQYATYLINLAQIKQTRKNEKNCQRSIKISWWIIELKSDLLNESVSWRFVEDQRSSCCCLIRHRRDVYANSCETKGPACTSILLDNKHQYSTIPNYSLNFPCKLFTFLSDLCASKMCRS